MALISDYLENKLCNDLFRDNKKPVYAALFYDNPTDPAQSLELTGRGYKRELVEFDSPLDGLIKNSKDIVYYKATSRWQTVTHLGLFNAEQGGHMFFYGELSMPIDIIKNKNFFIKLGDLQVGFE